MVIIQKLLLSKISLIILDSNEESKLIKANIKPTETWESSSEDADTYDSDRFGDDMQPTLQSTPRAKLFDRFGIRHTSK